MENHFNIAIDGLPARVKDPGAGKPALITEYGSLDDYIAMFKKHYEERRAEFFDFTPEDGAQLEPLGK